jgi:hypothetical protein
MAERCGAAMLPTLKIPPLCFELFLDDFVSIPIASSRGCKVAKRKDSTGFRDQHAPFFVDANLAYAPDLSKYPDGLLQACGDLSERAMEIVMYIEMTEPWPEEPMTPQFLEARR